jgi:hypothetical protein
VEEAGKVLRMAAADVVALREEAFKEEAFFEYHLYSLDRKTTVKDNQTKQISLLAAAGVGTRKEFVLRGEPYYYQGQTGELAKQKVGVYVEFNNSKENGLGMPLPRGIVRLYKRDSGGGLQFIGENRVDHTPRDEKVRLKVGEAFDIVAERRQTDWRVVGRDTYETAYEIKLRNHKDEDVAVRVIEPIPGDWKVLESSHKHEKAEAHTAEFLVPVPKGGEAVLTYRVRTRWW